MVNLYHQNITVGKILSIFWKQLFFFMLIIASLSFFISTILPVKYEADTSIIIIQKNASGLDAYREIKSAEFAGKIAKQIILSNSVMEKVMEESNAAKSDLSKEANPSDRLDEWQDMVSVSQASNSGILNISVRASKKQSSLQILNALVDILQKNNAEYFGSDQIGIKVINKPFYLEDPVFPNIPLNIIAGILLGLGIIVFFIAMSKEKFFYLLVKLFSK